MVEFFPWRSAVAMFVIVALPLAWFFDWGMGEPEALSEFLPEGWSLLDGYPRDVIGRVLISPFKLLLALGALAALLYGLVQMIVGQLDRRLATADQDRIGLPGRMLRAFSGRFGLVDRKIYIERLLAAGGEVMLAPLRLGIAAFPMLGFVGTVIGLSSTIEKLPAALRNKDTALQGVLDSLNIAFDTTLLGLIGAIFCLLTLRIAESALDNPRTRS